jgi:hypothetical protein
MVPVVKEFGLVMAKANGFMVEMIKAMMALFGIKSERRNPNATSQGAAVRNANVTSVEGFARDLFALNAKNLFGGEKSKDPVIVQQEILDAIKSGQDAAMKLLESIRDFVKPISDLYTFLKERIPNMPKIPGAGDLLKDNLGSGLAPGLSGPGKAVIGAGISPISNLGSLGIGSVSPIGSLIGLLGRAKLT